MTGTDIVMPASGEPFVLRCVLVPRTFRRDEDLREMLPMDIGIADGVIRFVEPADARTATDWTEVALRRTMVLPCFADAHVHLDSTQIWDRSPNLDGTFESAAEAIINDRLQHWTAQDMLRRMDFGLRCAYAHGVRAMRTHLASQNEQIEQRWEIFAQVREAWKGRIALQAVPLISTEVLADDAWLKRVTDVVVSHRGGVMGAFAPVGAGIDEQIARLFEIAERHDLALDFHADETMDAGSDVLRRIATTALARGSEVPVLVGHCCSLAVQDEAAVDATLDLVARSGVAIVSLPSTNLYLQGRAKGRTPRARGVTVLHELAERNIPVCIGGDNCRDPYHPYGDFNPLENLRDAVRIAHLDHPLDKWPHSVTTTPARIIDKVQDIAPGAPADLVLYDAASFAELFARPWLVRRLVRNGDLEQPLLPDFSELET